MNLIEYYQIFDQKMRKVIENDGLTPADVWAGSQIKPIPRALPAVPYQMQDGSQVLITGDPFFWESRLDHNQGGDNAYGVKGTCVLTAISNVCKMAGMAVEEPEVVNYAMSNQLSLSSGATFPGGALKVMKHFGFEAHIEYNVTAKCDRIAEWIEGGYGVVCSVNQGILQHKPHRIVYEMTGTVVANHAVCMIATVRDAYTGALKGFYLSDSSYNAYSGGRMIYASVEMMKECYEKIAESALTITNKRIR